MKIQRYLARYTLEQLTNNFNLTHVEVKKDFTSYSFNELVEYTLIALDFEKSNMLADNRSYDTYSSIDYLTYKACQAHSKLQCFYNEHCITAGR